MNRVTTISLLALLAAPTAAAAAPAKISPNAAPVSTSGVATVQIANPNAYALSGKATITVGGRSASKRIRLPRRSVTDVKLRLARKAPSTGRASVAVRLSRRGGRPTTVKRTVSLRPAAGAPAPAQGVLPTAAPPVAAPAPTPAAAPAPAAVSRWVGRMGADGGYDDLELTLDNGQVTFTKAPALPVLCFETPDASNTWTSGELFDAPGPWAAGDSAIDKQGVSVNPLVGRSPRTITYKMTGLTQADGKITGTLGMIFYAARPDVFTGATTIVNCHGSESFEAVPA